ncbi:hypothetical protein K488DRAFT_73551 [Vararia minispora EC-137]|uniref:Uncharacterized protein n=1 Tax=Vararia minispora EC-137 TaxID=1314806 RepID=A0ACB8QAF9_9AGAM|nr:hypothetical protein K488DRAFT_73551 [Vararia minispora EC-137]
MFTFTSSSRLLALEYVMRAARRLAGIPTGVMPTGVMPTTQTSLAALLPPEIIAYIMFCSQELQHKLLIELIHNLKSFPHYSSDSLDNDSLLSYNSQSCAHEKNNIAFDLMRLGQVCSQWRQTALSYSNLWGTIFLNFTGIPLGLEYLQRSRKSPLHLNIATGFGSPVPRTFLRMGLYGVSAWAQSACDFMSDALRTQGDRLASVHLYGYDINGTMGTLVDATPLPKLTSITIVQCGLEDHDGVSLTDFFRIAPNIQSIAISGVLLAPSLPLPSPHLTYLKISGRAGESVIDWEMLEVFAYLPVLERLVLEDSFPTFPPPTMLSTPISLSPTVQSISLHSIWDRTARISPFFLMTEHSSASYILEGQFQSEPNAVVVHHLLGITTPPRAVYIHLDRVSPRQPYHFAFTFEEATNRPSYGRQVRLLSHDGISSANVFRSVSLRAVRLIYISSNNPFITRDILDSIRPASNVDTICVAGYPALESIVNLLSHDVNAFPAAHTLRIWKLEGDTFDTSSTLRNPLDQVCNLLRRRKTFGIPLGRVEVQAEDVVAWTDAIRSAVPGLRTTPAPHDRYIKYGYSSFAVDITSSSNFPDLAGAGLRAVIPAQCTTSVLYGEADFHLSYRNAAGPRSSGTLVEMMQRRAGSPSNKGRERGLVSSPAIFTPRDSSQANSRTRTVQSGPSTADEALVRKQQRIRVVLELPTVDEFVPNKVAFASASGIGWFLQFLILLNESAAAGRRVAHIPCPIPTMSKRTGGGCTSSRRILSTRTAAHWSTHRSARRRPMPYTLSFLGRVLVGAENTEAICMSESWTRSVVICRDARGCLCAVPRQVVATVHGGHLARLDRKRCLASDRKRRESIHSRNQTRVSLRRSEAGRGEGQSISHGSDGRAQAGGLGKKITERALTVADVRPNRMRVFDGSTHAADELVKLALVFGWSACESLFASP